MQPETSPQLRSTAEINDRLARNPALAASVLKLIDAVGGDPAKLDALTASTQPGETLSLPKRPAELIVATREDLEAIEEGLKFVWDRKLDFIFSDRSKIRDTIIASFDDTTLYTWRLENEAYVRADLPLRCSTAGFTHDWWCCGAILRGLPESLPKDWQNRPLISGALMTPFIQNQLKKNGLIGAYATRESYLATIVHEFGHVYFNQTWGERCTAGAIRCARDLYKGFDESAAHAPAFPVFNRTASEVFAFCTDRAASVIFWPSHVQDLNRYHAHHLEGLLSRESRKEVADRRWDLMEPHTAAAILGPLCLERWGDKWPAHLLQWGYADPFNMPREE